MAEYESVTSSDSESSIELELQRSNDRPLCSRTGVTRFLTDPKLRIPALKPQRPDDYYRFSQISVMRFVRDRELGIQGMSHRHVNIKYCYNVTQWCKRTWCAYESDLHHRMRSECHRQKTIARKAGLVARFSSATKQAIYYNHWRDITCHNTRRPSLHINVVVDNYKFIEIVLFTESKLELPTTALAEFFDNRMKYSSYETLCEYLFACTSFDELLSMLLRAVRRDICDENNDDGYFTDFIQSMWEVYAPSTS